MPPHTLQTSLRSAYVLTSQLDRLIIVPVKLGDFAKCKGISLVAVPLVIPNAALVRLGYISGATVAYNVLGGIISGGTVINQALANALGSAIKTYFSSNLAQVVGTAVSLQSVGVRDIRSANLPEFIDSGAPVAGTATGDLLPKGTAYAVTLRTARAGPSYRGRVYLFGFTELNNDPTGNAPSAVQTAALNFVVGVQSAMSSNGLTMCVLSRPAEAKRYTVITTHPDGSTTTQEKQTKARPGAATQITAIVSRNNIWDSQRRRSAPGSQSTLFRPLAGVDLDTGIRWGEEIPN